jgi:hypothetical protein
VVRAVPGFGVGWIAWEPSIKVEPLPQDEPPVAFTELDSGVTVADMQEAALLASGDLDLLSDAWLAEGV